MKQTKRIQKKISAFILALAFFCQDLAWAAPFDGAALQPMTPIQSLLQNPTLFEAPLQFASLREIHQGSGNVFIIHIQDAHSNLSGQQNLAGALDEIMTKYPVSLILSEGGAGDCSLDKFRKAAPKARVQLVAKSFLMSGEIQGEEYLNLISDHPMKIMGLEDMNLYRQSLESYSRLAGKREEILEYLKVMHRSLEKLKNKHYPTELLEYEKNNQANFENQFKGLLKLIGGGHDDLLASYPNLLKLKTLLEKEKTLDFDAANLEQAALVEKIAGQISEEEFKKYFSKAAPAFGVSASPSFTGQFAYFQKTLNIAKQKNISLDDYSHWAEYGDYLKEFSGIDLESVLDELVRAEDKVYQVVLTESDAQLIRSIDRYLGLLDKAYRIQMTTKDFNLWIANEPDFSTASYQAFLNRKLAEAGYYEDLVPYQPILEEGKNALIQFYDSVANRDLAFIKNTETSLDQQKIAVLITGGYHTDHLTQLFKEKGYSYAVLTPTVTAETNQKKYEKLLLEPLQEKKKSFESTDGQIHSDKSLGSLGKDFAVKPSTTNVRMQLLGMRPDAMKEFGARLGVSIPVPTTEHDGLLRGAESVIQGARLAIIRRENILKIEKGSDDLKKGQLQKLLSAAGLYWYADTRVPNVEISGGFKKNAFALLNTRGNRHLLSTDFLRYREIVNGTESLYGYDLFLTSNLVDRQYLIQFINQSFAGHPDASESIAKYVTIVNEIAPEPSIAPRAVPASVDLKFERDKLRALQIRDQIVDSVIGNMSYQLISANNPVLIYNADPSKRPTTRNSPIAELDGKTDVQASINTGFYQLKNGELFKKPSKDGNFDAVLTRLPKDQLHESAGLLLVELHNESDPENYTTIPLYIAKALFEKGLVYLDPLSNQLYTGAGSSIDTNYRMVAISMPVATTRDLHDALMNAGARLSSPASPALRLTDLPEGRWWKVITARDDGFGRIYTEKLVNDPNLDRGAEVNEGGDSSNIGLLAKYLPKFAEDLGVSSLELEGSIEYPDKVALNARILRLNQIKPAVFVTFWDNEAGEFSVEDYLEHWRRKEAVYTRTGPYHFHDVNVHLVDFLLMPQELVETSSRLAEFLYRLSKDNELSSNPIVKKEIEIQMVNFVRDLDALTAGSFKDLVLQSDSAMGSQIPTYYSALSANSMKVSDYARRIISYIEKKQIEGGGAGRASSYLLQAAQLAQIRRMGGIGASPTASSKKWQDKIRKIASEVGDASVAINNLSDLYKERVAALMGARMASAGKSGGSYLEEEIVKLPYSRDDVFNKRLQSRWVELKKARLEEFQNYSNSIAGELDAEFAGETFGAHSNFSKDDYPKSFETVKKIWKAYRGKGKLTQADYEILQQAMLLLEKHSRAAGNLAVEAIGELQAPGIAAEFKTTDKKLNEFYAQRGIRGPSEIALSLASIAKKIDQGQDAAEIWLELSSISGELKNTHTAMIEEYGEPSEPWHDSIHDASLALRSATQIILRQAGNDVDTICQKNGAQNLSLEEIQFLAESALSLNRISKRGQVLSELGFDSSRLIVKGDGRYYYFYLGEDRRGGIGEGRLAVAQYQDAEFTRPMGQIKVFEEPPYDLTKRLQDMYLGDLAGGVFLPTPQMPAESSTEFTRSLEDQLDELSGLLTKDEIGELHWRLDNLIALGPSTRSIISTFNTFHKNPKEPIREKVTPNSLHLFFESSDSLGLWQSQADISHNLAEMVNIIWFGKDGLLRNQRDRSVIIENLLGVSQSTNFGAGARLSATQAKLPFTGQTLTREQFEKMSILAGLLVDAYTESGNNRFIRGMSELEGLEEQNTKQGIFEEALKEIDDPAILIFLRAQYSADKTFLPQVAAISRRLLALPMTATSKELSAVIARGARLSGALSIEPSDEREGYLMRLFNCISRPAYIKIATPLAVISIALVVYFNGRILNTDESLDKKAVVISKVSGIWSGSPEFGGEMRDHWYGKNLSWFSDHKRPVVYSAAPTAPATTPVKSLRFTNARDSETGLLKTAQEISLTPKSRPSDVLAYLQVARRAAGLRSDDKLVGLIQRLMDDIRANRLKPGDIDKRFKEIFLTVDASAKEILRRGGAESLVSEFHRAFFLRRLFLLVAFFSGGFAFLTATFLGFKEQSEINVRNFFLSIVQSANEKKSAIKDALLGIQGVDEDLVDKLMGLKALDKMNNLELGLILKQVSSVEFQNRPPGEVNDQIRQIIERLSGARLAGQSESVVTEPDDHVAVSLPDNVKKVNLSGYPITLTFDGQKITASYLNFDRNKEPTKVEKLMADGDVFRIGRSANGNDVVLTGDAAISSQHLKIVQKAGEWYGVDNSTNGTTFDGTTYYGQEFLIYKPAGARLSQVTAKVVEQQEVLRKKKKLPTRIELTVPGSRQKVIIQFASSIQTQSTAIRMQFKVWQEPSLDPQKKHSLVIILSDSSGEVKGMLANFKEFEELGAINHWLASLAGKKWNKEDLEKSVPLADTNLLDAQETIHAKNLARQIAGKARVQLDKINQALEVLKSVSEKEGLTENQRKAISQIQTAAEVISNSIVSEKAKNRGEQILVDTLFSRSGHEKTPQDLPEFDLKNKAVAVMQNAHSFSANITGFSKRLEFTKARVPEMERIISVLENYVASEDLKTPLISEMDPTMKKIDIIDLNLYAGARLATTPKDFNLVEFNQATLSLSQALTYPGWVELASEINQLKAGSVEGTNAKILGDLKSYAEFVLRQVQAFETTNQPNRDLLKRTVSEGGNAAEYDLMNSSRIIIGFINRSNRDGALKIADVERIKINYQRIASTIQLLQAFPNQTGQVQFLEGLGRPYVNLRERESVPAAEETRVEKGGMMGARLAKRRQQEEILFRKEIDRMGRQVRGQLLAVDTLLKNPKRDTPVVVKRMKAAQESIGRFQERISQIQTMSAAQREEFSQELDALSKNLKMTDKKLDQLKSEPSTDELGKRIVALYLWHKRLSKNPILVRANLGRFGTLIDRAKAREIEIAGFVKEQKFTVDILHQTEKSEKELRELIREIRRQNQIEKNSAADTFSRAVKSGTYSLKPETAAFAKTFLTKKGVENLGESEKVLIKKLAVLGMAPKKDGQPRAIEIQSEGSSQMTLIHIQPVKGGVNVEFSTNEEVVAVYSLTKEEVQDFRDESALRPGALYVDLNRAQKELETGIDQRGANSLEVLSTIHERDRLNRFAMIKVPLSFGEEEKVVVGYLPESSYTAEIAEQLSGEFNSQIKPILQLYPERVRVAPVENGKLTMPAGFEKAKVILVGALNEKNIAYAQSIGAGLVPQDASAPSPNKIPVMAYQAILILAIGTALLKTSADGRVNSASELERLAQLHSQLVDAAYRGEVSDVAKRLENFNAMRAPQLSTLEILKKLVIHPVARLSFDDILRVIAARLTAVGAAA